MAAFQNFEEIQKMSKEVKLDRKIIAIVYFMS